MNNDNVTPFTPVAVPTVEEAPEVVAYKIELKNDETYNVSGILDFNPYFAAILDPDQPGRNGGYRASHIFNWSEVKSIITTPATDEVPF